jgi:uncharacterized protein (DUF2235 family)
MRPASRFVRENLIARLSWHRTGLTGLEEKMAKNIVLCSDGTGNQDIKNRGTNVFKLYEAVDVQGHKNGKLPKQVAFYDDGVGTENPITKVIGGAFGWGFSRNVKRMYRGLANVYEPEDSIYLFGFSRGAYTVRALAGLIQHCGILDAAYYRSQDRKVATGQIDACWEDFRQIAFRRASTEERRGAIPQRDETELRQNATIERRKAYHAVRPEEKIDIAFIGAWDTVGAIGVPFDELRKLISFFYPIWFADNTLGAEVRHACQALSLDDERRTFHPELWNEQNGADDRLQQVWFSGAHSNVGGGYPKQGLSLVTLDWMMTHAERAGLRFIDEDVQFVRDHQDVHDRLYDSRSGFAVYYRWAPRDIVKLCAEHRINKPKIHASVFERIANGTNAYAPGNIPFGCDVDVTGGLVNWPALRVPGDIQALLNTNGAGHAGSLLEDMDETVRNGKMSYYVFLIITLFALLSLVCLSVYPGWPLVLWLGSAFLICIVLIYSWAQHVDSSLEKKYTGFWRRCRSDLSHMLQ